MSRFNVPDMLRHRMVMSIAVLVLMILAVRAGEAAADTRVVRAGWFTVRHDVRSPADNVIQLPSRVLVRDSVRVSVGDLPLIAGHDFVVDYRSRRVRLTRVWPSGSTIIVRYRALPVDWPVRRQWMVPAPPPGDSSRISPPETFVTRVPSVEQSGDLRIGGSKTFAIQVGSNRDLTLEQSLRVSVNGTVGEDVRVTAELSDQNLPIQPEGTTEDIREIDKVLVQIESPHYLAVLGNYDVSYRRGEFGVYDRRLEGAQGRGRWERGMVTGGVASARGRFRSYELPIIDGIQGPYRLVDDVGNTGVVVIAGSERVWLDGQPLRRGQNNDYTMDYGAGEIIFTRTRLMTGDMRVIIDYEHASEDYARTSGILAGEFGSRTGAWQAALFYAQEGDNAEDPLAVILDDAARELLSAAGDDPTKAAPPGWFSDTTGNYCAVDLAEARFEYISDPNGACPDRYSVQFSRVAPGEGTYVRVESLFANQYDYVGPGRGDYVPYILYPLPERTRVGTLWGRASPTRHVSAEVELAMSDFDRNTLSPVDDGDNRTYAGRFDLKAGEVPVGDGELSASVTGRTVQKGFTTLSRTNPAEDNRRWGLPLSEARGQERTLSGKLIYRPIPDHVLLLDAGWFDRDTAGVTPAYEAVRGGALWTSSAAGLPSIRAFAEGVRSETTHGGGEAITGAVGRGEARASHTIGWLRPGARVKGEVDRREQAGARIAGDRFGEWSGELATAGVETFAASALVERRVDQAWDTTLTSWRDQQRSLTQTWRGAVRSWRGLSTTAEYSWRRRTGDAVGAATVSDVADVDVAYDPWSGVMRHDLRYRVTSTRTAEREQAYVFVGSGRGDYAAIDPDENRAILSYEEVEPVPPGDPDGAYILRYRDTDTFRPTVTLDASYRLNLDLDRVWQAAPDPRSNERRPLWQRALRVFRTETSLQVTEIDTARSSELYTVQFWTFRRPGVSPTLRGTWSALQDVTMWPDSRRGDVRLRVRASEEYDASLLDRSGTPDITQRREYRARGRIRFARLRSDWTGDIAHERESSEGGSFDFRSRRWTFEHSWAYHPTFRTEIALTNENAFGRDPTPSPDIANNAAEALDAYLVSLEPSVRRAWGNRGMLRVAAQWSGVYTTNLASGRALPVQLLSGRDGGNNYRWSALANYRLSALVTASLTYTGKKTPGDKAVHTGRMEMRAVF